MISSMTVAETISIPITVDYLVDDEVYQVSCPWLQGCHAWGVTLDEAIRAIPENIRAMVAARRSKGSRLPVQLQEFGLDTPFSLRMVVA